MILGGTLADVLKPPTIVTGRTQVLVIHDNPDSGPRADACIWTDRNKAC